MSQSIQISILCGEERHWWINPALCQASLLWVTSPKRRFDLEFLPARGFHTSQEARNWATDEFLKRKRDFLLMIDNDTRPERDGACIDLPVMAALDLPIIGAPVPVVNGQKLYVNFYFQDGSQYRTPVWEDFEKAQDTNGLVECDAVGGGAVMFRRDVLETLTDLKDGPYCTAQELEYLPKLSRPYPVWLRPREATGKTWIGEDLFICTRAKRLGFKVYCSLPHLCGRFHTVDQGSVPEIQSSEQQAEWTAKDYGLEEPVPPITPWSITPRMAQRLRESVRELTPPACILELGSGISTLVLADALHAHSTVITIEHDYREVLKGLEGRWFQRRENKPQIFPLWWPLKDGWYAPADPQEVWDKVNLLFIDGPPGATCKLARYPAVPQLKNCLVPGATIILDDVHRPDERECVERWTREFPVTLESIETFEHGRQMAILKWAAS